MHHFIAVAVPVTASLFFYALAAADTEPNPLLPNVKGLPGENVQQPKDEMQQPPTSEPDPLGQIQCNGFSGSPTPILLGLPGPAGPYGPQGIPGVPGPMGMPGNHGNNGNNGAPGFPGAKGQKGVRGEPGVPGQHGTPGVEGPDGRRGSSGARGDEGPRGLQGPIGKTGSQGSPGPAGMIGPRGIPGAKGDIGYLGSKGEKGDCICPQTIPNPESTRRNKISFSVARTTGLFAEHGPVIIKWNHLFSNVGGTFKLNTGIFNCTVSGSYYFSFHVYKSSNQNYPFIQLMKNGEHQVGAIDYGPTDSEDSTSNSVILDLQVADLVYLQLYADRELYSSHYKFTTFSGFLLFEK